MAKPFYSMDEVCEKLGKSEDDVRALVREGTLREFRDAGKVFFKAEDVDQLAGGGQQSADEVDLEPAEDEMPSLSDSASGTSIIGLEPLDDEPDEKPPQKEDTAVSTSGVGVFDDDELEVDADPMAKTQITDASMDDQVQLDSSGSGSGSGLLDLTRESDDTSLGAELLDEIYPGEEEAAPAAPADQPEPEPEPAAATPAEPVTEDVVVRRTVPTGDPSEGVFGGLLVGALILLTLAGSVAAANLQGTLPGYAAYLTNNLLIFAGGAAGVVGLSLLVGWLIGRSAAR